MHRPRLIFTVLIVISMALLAWLISPLASSFLVASVIAAALHPWTDALERRLGGRRALAAGLMTAAVLLAVLVPLGVVGGFLVKEGSGAVKFVKDALQSDGAHGLVAKLPEKLEPYGQRALAFLPAEVEALLDGQTHHGDGGADEISAESVGGRDEKPDGVATERRQPQRGGERDAGGKSSAASAAAVVGGAVRITTRVLIQVVLGLIALYFLLIDGRRLVEWLGAKAPLEPGQLEELLGEFKRTAVTVLRSTVLTAVALSLAGLIAFLIVGVPHAAFFALIYFFVAMIPLVGGAIMPLAVAGFMLLAGHPGAAIFLAAWGVGVVSPLDHFLKPWLMKGGLSLHGGIVFFGLVGGLEVFGPIGLLAGPLILAFFVALIRIYDRDYGRGARVIAAGADLAPGASPLAVAGRLAVGGRLAVAVPPSRPADKPPGSRRPESPAAAPPRGAAPRAPRPWRPPTRRRPPRP